ncbi:MAG: hypothetical protein PVH63_02860 [Balneolaceae bacterium]|jgi:hypothetical protein
MPDPKPLIHRIINAFTEVEPPPAWCLSNSREGTEPAALEEEFSEIPHWKDLSPTFLDATPDGFGTALGFFSDEAFRYYLPAYLVASVRNELSRVDPVFHLIHGLDNSSKDVPLNPRRYGSRSWGDYARFRHSIFSAKQAAAIAAYLEHERRSALRTESECRRIREALDNYWNFQARAANFE